MAEVQVGRCKRSPLSRNFLSPGSTHCLHQGVGADDLTVDDVQPTDAKDVQAPPMAPAYGNTCRTFGTWPITNGTSVPN